MTGRHWPKKIVVQGDHYLEIEPEGNKVKLSIVRRYGLKKYHDPVSIKFSANRYHLLAIAESLFEAFDAVPPTGFDELVPRLSSAQEDRFGDALLRAGVRFERHPSVQIGYKKDRNRRFCYPDFVSEEGWVVVFFDGCYYHGCPEHFPSRMQWRQDVDREIDERLRRNGWAVVRVWEHEDFDEAAQRVAQTISDRVATATATRESAS